YGGSDLICVAGGWEALDRLPLAAETRFAIVQARAYDDATCEFPGFMASRRNYDVGQGLDAEGVRRSGVFESSWPSGGASTAGFALGGWLAFEKAGTQSMVMGDLVLTADEVNPVMEKLVAGGIQVTALHNHLLRNQPFTMYMHVMGMGDPVKLAATLHAALAASKTPLAPAATGTSQPAAAPAAPPAIDLDTAVLDRALGAKGANNGGVYQFSIARAETIT